MEFKIVDKDGDVDLVKDFLWENELLYNNFHRLLHNDAKIID